MQTKLFCLLVFMLYNPVNIFLKGFVHLKLHIFPYPSIKICALVAQKNRLNEKVLLSTHKIMFWMRNKKNNFPVRILIWRPDFWTISSVPGLNQY